MRRDPGCEGGRGRVSRQLLNDSIDPAQGRAGPAPRKGGASLAVSCASFSKSFLQRAAVRMRRRNPKRRRVWTACRAEARAADAINVCGGVLPNVDKDSINMAQVLKDGQQLRVPERKEGTSSGSRSSNNGSKEGQININTADEKTLDELPGVGPAMAKRIVEYRETEGAFQSIEDIKKIKGIGEAKFNRMKDKLCL